MGTHTSNNPLNTKTSKAQACGDKETRLTVWKPPKMKRAQKCVVVCGLGTHKHACCLLAYVAM